MRTYSKHMVYTTEKTFGSPLIGRTYQAESLSGYRYSFNGKEKDDETYGDGNEMDFGARIYDGRLGRWLSVDPMYKTFPHESPYIAFGNSPIVVVDCKGKYKVIYIAFLPDSKTELTLDQKKEILQKAQQVLNENNIDITVVGIEVTQRIDVNLLNQSDNIVYLGTEGSLSKEFGDDYTKKDARSLHVTTQESWADLKDFSITVDPPITNFDEKIRKDDNELSKKEGAAKDREGWLAITVIHEASHRWFRHRTKSNYANDPNNSCNPGTASRENIMSCGEEVQDYGPNFPMARGTFRLFLKDQAQTLQKIYGKLSQAGWDKNKTRDNLTLKKGANDGVKKIE